MDKLKNPRLLLKVLFSNDYAVVVQRWVFVEISMGVGSNMELKIKKSVDLVLCGASWLRARIRTKLLFICDIFSYRYRN